MDRNIMILMNPKAGKGSAKTSLFTICNCFSAMQDNVQVYVTQYAKHARKLCEQHAASFNILVCIGGDGTWNEVVSGLLSSHAHPYVCYLPSGTVNDFGSSLKLSKSATKMMEKVKEYHPFPCDMGKFNDRYFTYIAAFGIFTDISYNTPQHIKNTLGKVAYFLEGFKQLTKIPQYHITYEINGESYEEDFIFGCITNSKSIAGFTSINAKDTELDDGLFEVLFIRIPNNPLDVQTIVAALLKHEVNEKWMVFTKCSHLKITSSQPIPWTLDGENGGETTSCSIDNLHKAIKILI